MCYEHVRGVMLFIYQLSSSNYALPLGMPFGMSGGHTRRQRQDPTVQHDVLVSLEDIYKGCTKKMKITRHVFVFGEKCGVGCLIALEN